MIEPSRGTRRVLHVGVRSFFERAVFPVVMCALVASTGLVACTARVSAPHVPIKRGYPSRSQLISVTQARPDAENERSSLRQIAVPSWDLVGPFPEAPGSTPLSHPDALTAAVIDGLASRPSRVTLTESMQCYARETGRFVARHGALPEDDLQAFTAARCGVIPVTPSYTFAFPPEPPSNEAAVAFFVEAASKLPRGTELGVFVGSDAGRHVLLATFGEPKIHLTSISEPLVDSQSPGGPRTFRIRGSVAERPAWLRGYTNFGKLDFRACEPTPDIALALPDFDLTCVAAAEDGHALFEMLGAAEDAVLGRQILLLMLPNGRPLPSTYRPLAHFDVNTKVPLLEQFNDLRARLGRDALREIRGQSETARALVPRYFAAAALGEFKTVDVITLGMMAGWDVPGPLRDAQFLSFRGRFDASDEDATNLLSQLLFFPSNRAVLMDPDSKNIALAADRDETHKTIRGILSTYTTFEPRSYAHAETRLLDELDRQRRLHGKAPVERITTRDATNVLDSVLEDLAQGELTPVEGLAKAMRTLSRRQHRGFDGRVAVAAAIEGFRPKFEGSVIEADKVAIMVKVGFFAGKGDHWGEYVAYFITSALTN